MQATAITQEEWNAVQWAAGAVTEAALAEDSAGRSARFADLRSILEELRVRHGDQPVLWETEADFTPNARTAANLYIRAERAAIDQRLPTLSIRLSLARLLVEEMDRHTAARETLFACKDELLNAGEADCATWATLLAACTPEAAEEPETEVGP